MTVSRIFLVVPLLWLAAAAPEAPFSVAQSDQPPAVTAPTAPPAGTAPTATPGAAQPNTPPALMQSNAPSPAAPPNTSTTSPSATQPKASPAATEPSASSAVTAPKLPPTVSLQKVAPQEAMPILGHHVAGPGGKDIARLVDILVDTDGQPVAAVLDFGGFMGVGSRKIAVHWSSLHFEPAETTHRIILSLTADEIKAAPEYKDPGKPAPVVVPAASVPKSAPQ